MKSQRLVNTPKLLGFFTLLFLAGLLSISCSEWIVPVELTGKWSAQQEITFREKIEGKYVFSKHQEKIEIVINSDGTVNGFIGQAKLIACKIVKNRRAFGKFLHIKTDYRITGKLQGKINSFDKANQRDVSMPFNVINNETQGTIFESSGFNIFPFAAMNLKK